MAVRSVFTTGFSFAAAAAVAVTVALAPPMSPRDVQVADDAGVALSAVVTDYPSQAAINAYFERGLAGVVQDQLLAGVSGDDPARTVIESYFGSGLSGVVRDYLAAQAGDLNGNYGDDHYNFNRAYLNIFFNDHNPFGTPEGTAATSPGLYGLSGVIVGLLARSMSPEQAGVLGDFAEGGVAGVVKQRLLANTDDPTEIRNITDFFEGGITKVIQTRLTDPSSATPAQAQVINDFFNGGATEVVKQMLLSSTTDPDQRANIALFFPDPYTGYRGGISQNIRQQLLNSVGSSSEATPLINGFFSGGISEVVRRIPVEPQAPQTVSPQARAAAAPLAAATPQKSDPVVVQKTTQNTLATVPEPEPKAKFKIHVDTDQGANEVADDNPGNKVEPEILVGDGGPKDGEGSWGIFGQVADSLTKSTVGAPDPGADAGNGDGAGEG